METPKKGGTPPKNLPVRERDVIPDNEFKELLRRSDDEMRKGLLILANTGMRLGELFSLKRESFDLAQGVLHLRSTTEFHTKNYESRTIPIPDAVINLVAPIPVGHPIMNISEKAFYDRLRRLRAKLGYIWTIHELRHTYVSKQLQANVPKRVVQAWVGHKSDRMTEKYSHYIPGETERYRNNINIGLEFTQQNDNVVTKWRPSLVAQNKKPATLNSYGPSIAPRAGFEPATG